jgi:tryptophan-rich sensory protein
VKCGCSLSQTNKDDKPNGGFAVLGFFVPIVGLILFLVWNKEYPRKAKSCGKGALIGFIVSTVLTIIWAVIMGGVLADILGDFY